jgi:tRNA A37 methylthiotransferase MiaB
MNVSDSELVAGILTKHGFLLTDSEDNADVVLLNTCAIRDKAEAKIWGKLHLLHHRSKLAQARRTYPGKQNAQRMPFSEMAERDVESLASGTRLGVTGVSAVTDGTLKEVDEAQSAAGSLHGWQRDHPVVGLLGCMAERLKDKLLESGLVDVVAGLPRPSKPSLFRSSGSIF